MILDVKMQFNKRRHPDSFGEHYVWIISFHHRWDTYRPWLEVMIIDGSH